MAWKFQYSTTENIRDTEAVQNVYNWLIEIPRIALLDGPYLRGCPNLQWANRSNNGLLGLYKCLRAIAVLFLSSSDKMAPAQTLPDFRAPSTPVLKQGVQEDYEGNYRFAPIEEAQVARAMIKRLVSIGLVSPKANSTGEKIRYFNALYERVISDVVIVGAGSAGLSCAYHLATTRPDVSITATSEPTIISCE